jgi:UDP-N-acetyl-D-galactosamine dehydrogenase
MQRKIAVIGLGYVGLPVAIAFGEKFRCIGFDINKSRIENLKNGVDRTKEVPLEKLNLSNLFYTYEIEDLKSADFYIVAVPTPVDNAHKPDLKPIESASKIVASVLKKGDIVVYESTVYPGVTEEICVPILEKESKLKFGVDFTVGYSPERINPGDKERNFTNIKKVVAASDEQSLEIIANTYENVVKAGIYKASSIKVAEAAKVIENTQRDLNISLMNELAVIFERMNIDTLEVLAAAETKWNFLSFRPGIVGGHCIGVDPYYLTYKAELLGYFPQVILAGRRINDNMGRYIARRAVKQLIKNNIQIINMNALVYGITFKENCPDVRNSKVIDIINELIDYNINVSVYDPIADKDAANKEYGIKIFSFDELPKAKLLILAVSHKEFKEMSLDYLLNKLEPNGLIFDVKSVLPKDKVQQLGYNIIRL